MHNEKGWNLPKPQLTLSIISGAKKFNVSSAKNAFQKSLIKATASASTLIITDGTNTGVMNLISQVVKDNNEIPIIITKTWDRIHSKQNNFMYQSEQVYI